VRLLGLYYCYGFLHPSSVNDCTSNEVRIKEVLTEASVGGTVVVCASVAKAMRPKAIHVALRGQVLDLDFMLVNGGKQSEGPSVGS
jgi:hypothetical protein